VILLDTNILVHAAGTRSPKHAAAKELRDRTASGQLDACLAAQVLVEFYAVVTDPRRFRPPLTPPQARGELAAYLASPLKVILPRPTTVARMLDLAGSRLARGGNIFDVFLAATMLDNGVRAIYTENVRDFAGIADIEAVNPFQ